ncbi:hypothetical protein SAMN05444411_102570 [Lutibacter oricola]|uniref:Tetratricopeptide repeat-containing protein n=1 Tax=Lutibacter oricola TaxID=762486 RepID=A0A1H2XVW0_9FLAO|nr:hypothetical protein [Lutibacter oricola]SDW97006.1 hypothetical protein SAMN05444411_102570 [Lutibacter oricola]
MKQLIYIFTFLITVTAIAQTTTNIEVEKQKLKQALAYNDKAVAASAMYSIIALEGETSTYKDSLAYMYFNNRNYVSCFLVSNDILKTKKGDKNFLEMSAVSLEQMGALEKSIEIYTDLLSTSNNNYHAYKIAGLQLALNKFDEAFAMVRKADGLPDTGKITVNFQVNKNYTQNVNLKAAIAYLQGIVEMNLKKNTEAKASFERAVTLFPEFVLAKSKLTTLNAEK